MNTSVPVFRSELQCRMLGMAITAYTPTGVPSEPDEAGELVCERAFPCMPVGFWPLSGFEASVEEVKKAQDRFMDAYFPELSGERGIWCKYYGFCDF